jgi:hypothetical protein
MWYEWNTKEDFDIWHNALCADLGYPIIGFNQLTGLPDETAQKTEAYTQAFEVEDKWIAWVADEYASDLEATDLRRPKPEESL